MLTTGLDLTVMLLLVEVVGLRPSLGALLGATVGAVFNFTASRRWVFPEGASKPAAGQALRYALVAAASAALNAAGVEAGEHLGVPYEIGRLLTSLVVSLSWNYPMQRRFVFGDRER
ncbi:MAG: GtrA family protein [Myxococcales bacterium]|nr:MAG: GtrA family protein [Myxococcales bacterium]